MCSGSPQMRHVPMGAGGGNSEMGLYSRSSTAGSGVRTGCAGLRSGFGGGVSLGLRGLLHPPL